MMELNEWLNLFVRWAHVIAGIMWIGQTYLFNFMEREMEPPQGAGKDNISGELWMVHGGGFFLVEKQKWPERSPKTLHWFKWEAMMTWLSGVALLAIVYWSGAPLLEYGSELSRAQGVGISVSVLVGGFIVYNLIWRSPLRKNEFAGAVVSWIAVVALTYGLTRVLSDRAAFIHIGAMFGTIMVANVWMVIIPNQRKMMALMEKGAKPNFALAAQSKQCSRHNTFMGVPLIFTMISNHFPATTFGRDYNWLILGLIILVGWFAAKLLRDYA